MSIVDVRATRTRGERERASEQEREREKQLPELASTINVTSNRVRYHTTRGKSKTNEEISFLRLFIVYY